MADEQDEHDTSLVHNSDSGVFLTVEAQSCWMQSQNVNINAHKLKHHHLFAFEWHLICSLYIAQFAWNIK